MNPITHHVDKENVKKPVEDILKASGMDLSNGGSLQELAQFKSSFQTIKLLCLVD